MEAPRLDTMSKGTSDSMINSSKGLRKYNWFRRDLIFLSCSISIEYSDEIDIDGDFEYENDKEKIVEQSPRGRFIRVVLSSPTNSKPA